MSRSALQNNNLINKIEVLPPEKLSEVEDFVDFLLQRNKDRQITKMASKLSEKALKKIWNNPDDAEYDRL